MAENSEISWTTHTFNPWIGCTKVDELCKFCYAEELMDNRYQKVKWGPRGERIRTSESNWKLPLKWDRAANLELGVRPRVFCASLADIFEDRPELRPWRSDLFALIERCRNLNWMLLTKRPENINSMIATATGRHAWAWLADCSHVWLGTSIGTRDGLARAADLAKCQSRIRFWSVEPLLEDLGDIKPYLDGVHLVIAGGESGRDARAMHPDWPRSIRDQCVASGVKFHFKQWGEWKPITEMPEAEHVALYKSNRIAGEGETQEVVDEFCGRSCTVPTTSIMFDGRTGGGFHSIDGHLAYQIFRVGKKRAGRALEGRIWDEMPA